jgi:hypothetical protein
VAVSPSGTPNPSLIVLTRPVSKLPDRQKSSCTTPRVLGQKNTVMGLVGSRSKNKCWQRSAPSLVEEETPFEDTGGLETNKTLVLGSLRDPKPRVVMLAKARRNLPGIEKQPFLVEVKDRNTRETSRHLSIQYINLPIRTLCLVS